MQNRILYTASFFAFAHFTLGCNAPQQQLQAPPAVINQPGVPAVKIDKDVEIKAPDRRVGDEFTKATDLYGPAVVFEGNFYMDVKVTPWSSSWYPYQDDYLFRDATSPLSKYDQYVKSIRGVASRAAEFEKVVHSRNEFAPWAGRCNAWAIASLMEPEPILTKPVTVNGVSFTKGDLKALLVLTYDYVEGITQFGQRNNGDEKSIPDDIYPEQFHRIIQKEIFERKRPIVMDKDLGMEIWNVPIHKTELTILKDSTNAHVVHVKAALVGAAPLDPAADPNSSQRKNVVYNYTYDLFGYPQLDGTMKVVYGVWTGDSVKSHPDFLWTLPDTKERKSRNTEVNVAIVEEIIKKAKATDIGQ